MDVTEDLDHSPLRPVRVQACPCGLVHANGASRPLWRRTIWRRALAMTERAERTDSRRLASRVGTERD